jgi:CTD small phosphatase-like protein 2
LDETLIHYPEHTEDAIENDFYMLRPGLHKFLNTLSELYEIVIFTAGTQDYADYVLDQVDFDNKISHRLYRQHTAPKNDIYIKDLSKIGRQIKKTIIVDNLPENFEKHKRNGIAIESWYDDLEDHKLYQLREILQKIAEKKPDDIRDCLDEFRPKLAEIGCSTIPRVEIDL